MPYQTNSRINSRARFWDIFEKLTFSISISNSEFPPLCLSRLSTFLSLLVDNYAFIIFVCLRLVWPILLVYIRSTGWLWLYKLNDKILLFLYHTPDRYQWAGQGGWLVGWGGNYWDNAFLLIWTNTHEI